MCIRDSGNLTTPPQPRNEPPHVEEPDRPAASSCPNAKTRRPSTITPLQRSSRCIQAEVVAAYRSQNDVESGFRQLKDPHVVGFSPMFHWTDPKIRVHIFYCVLALAVAHLMRREAHHAGMDLSVRDLLATLGGIEETILLYPTGNKGRPRAQRILTDTDPAQQQLFDLFSLDTYAPTR